MADTTNRGLGSNKMDPQTKHDIQSKGGHASAQKTNTNSKQMNPKQAVNKVKEKLEQTSKKAGFKGGSAMMGTAAGVVVGAAVGGLAGAALTDEKTRKKLSEFSKNAADIADKISAKASELSDKTDQATTQLSSDIRKLQKETNRE